ncbi:MAG: PKD domain-containing protein [Bacteroidetes bacterium]|nr:MAG: PKD domain-containing protein [Bacteroidota bacterium]
MAYRLLFGVTLLLLPFALVSQTAQFSASALSGCAPLVVTFDASASQGTGPLSYQWSFGNGNSASGPTQGAPGAAYINPGVYTVTLTVTSITGQVSPPVSQTITVFANPVADFSFTPAFGCPDLPVQLTDLSTPAGTTPISGWTWDFGDGGSSSLQNPVHSFGSGTYSLTLIAVDANGCQDVEVKPNVVYVSPGADISLSATGPLQTCNPTLSVPFQSALISTSSGPFSYDWHFGDGGTSTLAQPQHTYTAYGLYDVSLTLTDLSSGCAFSDTLPGFIRLLDQVVSATASVSGTCAPVAATFTQTSSLIQPGFVATWDFGDGSSQTGSATTLGTVTHTYTLPGTYLPVLTVDMGTELCIQSYALPAVQVAAAPSVQLLRSDSVACQPPLAVNFTSAGVGDTAWLWTFGDGTTSTLQNPVHTYTTYGSYPVSLTVWNASGCSDSQQIPAAVRIIDPVAAFSHNLADFTVYPQYWDGRDPWPIRGGCLPLDITFADQSTSPTPIISYAWTFGDGTTTNTLNDSILHTYVTEGEFGVTLTITTSDGCVRADTCAPCIRAGNPPTALLDTTGYPTLSCCDPATLFINQTDTATHDYVWYAVTTGDWEGFVVNDSVNGNWDFSTIVPVFMDSGQYVSTMFYAYNFGCVDSFDLYHWTMLRPPWGAAGIDLLPCKSNWPPGGVVVFDTSLVSYVPDTSYIDSVLWEFGDPANSTSNELYPTFTYPDTGAYWITVTTWNFSIGCSCRVSGQQFLKIVVLPDTTFAVFADEFYRTHCKCELLGLGCGPGIIFVKCAQSGFYLRLDRRV